MFNADVYIRDIEKQNEELRSLVDRYTRTLGAAYQIYVVDDTLDTLDFSKVMEYYQSHGWILMPKRSTPETKRRWEYFSLTDHLRHKLESQSDILNLYSFYKQPFMFPYKPKEKTMFKKYGSEYSEAINKFNIMLGAQARLENRFALEIYDQWVNEYSIH